MSPVYDLSLMVRIKQCMVSPIFKQQSMQQMKVAFTISMSISTGRDCAKTHIFHYITGPLQNIKVILAL